MGISCALTGHYVTTRGIRNGKYEFGRCQRCSCDLMRSDSSWKRVPRGFKVVWRPAGAGALAHQAPGAAAIGREVDLRGVTVVGERSYGSQRFALVILNSKDQKSYRSMVDQLGTSGHIAESMESRGSLIGRARVSESVERTRGVTDMLVTNKQDRFEWEEPSPPARRALPQRGSGRQG